MNKVEYITACEKLRSECLNIASDGKNGNADGVISIERYFESKDKKILWLLKESWGNGGVNQAEELSKYAAAADYFSNEREDGYPTYAPMIQLAGLMKGLKDFDVFNSVEAFSAFKESTSFVNCKKIPGLTSSYNKEIGCFAKLYYGIIERQVSLYNPSVIIGGNTLRHFFDVNSPNSSVFEQVKLLQAGMPAPGLAGIQSFSVFGDRIPLGNCRALKRNGYDFGVYVGDKYLFIDADHPSYAKRADDYCAALFDIIADSVL